MRPIIVTFSKKLIGLQRVVSKSIILPVISIYKVFIDYINHCCLNDYMEFIACIVKLIYFIGLFIWWHT